MAILITNSPPEAFKVETEVVKETFVKTVKEVETQGPSFLNKEGNTTVKDFFAKIIIHVKAITGWDTFVEFNDNRYLVIKIKNSETFHSVLLNYDVIDNREIYGRVKHVGFTASLLNEICEFNYIDGKVEKISDYVEPVIYARPQVTAKIDQLSNHPDIAHFFTQPKMSLLGYVVPNMIIANFEQENIDEARKLYNTLGDRGLVRFRNWLDT